jgi:hypothetical protein
MTSNSPMQRLSGLVGTWAMNGRTLSSAEDNITGEITISPILGGGYLELKGTMKFMDNPEFESLEIIHYDESRDVFPSLVYATMGGLTSSPPLEYEWEINGDVVLHRDEGSTYTGKFSQDGKVLDGGWRPNEGQDSSDESAYDLTMTKIH